MSNIAIGPITTNANSDAYLVKPRWPMTAVVRTITAHGNFAASPTIQLYAAPGTASNLTVGSVNYAPVAGGDFTEATQRAVTLQAGAYVFANSVNTNANAGTNIVITIEG